jgi:hypothetical protein
MSCSHAPSCPLARVFAGKPSLRIWSERYCEGRYEACARFTHVACGVDAPSWLLPNGRSLVPPPPPLPPEAWMRRSA